MRFSVPLFVVLFVPLVVPLLVPRFVNRSLKCGVRRAQPPALTENDRGCFLPDLTRLTTLQCEETRRGRILSAQDSRLSQSGN